LNLRLKNNVIYDTAHVYFKFGLLDLYVGFFQNNQKAWNAGEKWMRKVVVVGSDQTNKIYSKSLLSALT